VNVPVFTALDTGRTIDADGQQLPTVVIDAAGLAEIADLARVHSVEGIGDIRTEAVRTEDLLLLGIRVTVPVRAAFVVALDVRHHRDLLEDIVEHGSLVIAHTDPRYAAADQPHWLAVDIDGASLAGCLAAE
jgi:hypothetical protein